MVEEAFPGDGQIILMNPAYDISDEFIFDQNFSDIATNLQVNTKEYNGLTAKFSINAEHEANTLIKQEILCVTESIGNTKLE